MTCPVSSLFSEPDLTPLVHERLHEQVFNRLRQNLMVGRFAPGQKLPLRGLAQALGTSLMPVRDAVNRLESLGVLVSTPGRTLMVPVLGPAEKQDLIRLRLLLETESVAAAVRIRTEAQLERLRADCRAIRLHAEAGDMPAYLEANYRFHMGLAEASGISFLTTLLDPLWMRTGPLVRELTPERADMLRSVGYHEAISAAIAAGDEAAARRSLAADIVESNGLTLA